MPRLWARATPYARSMSLPCSQLRSRRLWNVLNTSWLATPMRSRARGRSSAMNDPVAAKFLRSMISAASTARYSSDAVLRRQLHERGVEIAQLLLGVTGLLELVAARQLQRLDAVADVGVGVVPQPGRRLHDVGVRVVDDPPLDVRHPSSLPRFPLRPTQKCVDLRGKTPVLALGRGEQVFDTLRVGFNNPAMPWRELERRLSRRPRPTNVPPNANGGDSPAWSRKRQPYEAPPVQRPARRSVPYAELHCHSNFSFLDGASHPEELAEEAARLGLDALAITDHDGFYGVVRFAEAARAVGLPTVFGAELTLRAARKPQNGAADPEGNHLLVLARDPAGYARLARTISAAQMAGRRRASPSQPLPSWPRPHGGHWLVLTGCRKGTVPARARCATVPPPRSRALADLVALFGRANVAVELWDHGDPLDSARNDALAAARGPRRCRVRRHQQRALRTRRRAASWPPRSPPCAPGAASTRSTGGCPAAAAAHLRAGRRAGAPVRALSRCGRAGRRARARAARSTSHSSRPSCRRSRARRVTTRCRSCAASPRRARSAATATARDARAAERVRADRPRARRSSSSSASPATSSSCGTSSSSAGAPTSSARAAARPRTRAVCYALGITNADAVTLGLLFERFLSPERDGPPDIDIDIESDRREEASSTSTSATAASTPRRSPTSSPTAPSRRCATWPRRSATPPASRTRGRSRSTRGAAVEVDRHAAARPRHPRRGARAGRTRSSTSLAISASTRAAWSSATGR